MLIPVILSGGAGTRLWPVSREAHPKPFMRLPDGQSLLQKTLSRASALDGVEHVLTITNKEYYFQTRDEYAAIGRARRLDLDFVLEPMGRNTAPAIAMAALRIQQRFGDDAVLLVLPADHVIEDLTSFGSAVARAQRLAQDGYLCTFGVKPTAPETGYGYIEQGAALNPDSKGAQAYQVSRFVEKPDLDTAKSYLEAGTFLWNAGMFCFKPAVMLQALQRYAPEIHQAVQACWTASRGDMEPFVLDADTFAAAPAISIDYAVMERAERVAVVACEFDWSDVGSWAAVGNLAELDTHGNRTVGETLCIDTSNCYVHSDERLVATLGVENLIVIDTPDALLVANRDQCQDVKRIVERLKADGHEAYRFHRTVHRPWGTYTVLEEGDRFKMKRIVVKPGAELSLQMHHHRSEHWIVVSGTAKVINGDNEYLVRSNESTYVPAGNRHRLTNPGVIELVMIEVQSGDYLGEDDIVRVEDNYGRI